LFSELTSRYETELQSSKALLVGHGHFDHLTDAPHTLRRWMPHTVVYGSEAVKDLLAPLARQVPVTSVESAAHNATYVDVVRPCADQYLDLVRTATGWEQSGPAHGAGRPRFRLIKK
jgi:hypothetical protein